MNGGVMNYPATFDTVKHTKPQRGLGIFPMTRFFALVYCWISVPALLAYFYERLARAGMDHFFILKRIVERNFLLLSVDVLGIAVACLILARTKIAVQKEEHNLLNFCGMLWIGYLVARLSTPGHIPISLWMGVYAFFLALIVLVLKEWLFKAEKREK
ncbi:hypothetical protein [Methylacidiphilum caldifontis]|nr:hypothetical protein [Methylacidiphilum caldifontis]